MKHYEVEFYEDEHGSCPVADWIRELDSVKSKESKSMLKKIYFQIERLENEGPGVGEPIAKRLNENIWELRPIPDRIFFGVMKGEKIVLLHHFRKKRKKHQDMKLSRRNANFKTGSNEVKIYEMV